MLESKPGLLADGSETATFSDLSEVAVEDGVANWPFICVFFMSHEKTSVNLYLFMLTYLCF